MDIWFEFLLRKAYDLSKEEFEPLFHSMANALLFQKSFQNVLQSDKIQAVFWEFTDQFTTINESIDHPYCEVGIWERYMNYNESICINSDKITLENYKLGQLSPTDDEIELNNFLRYPSLNIRTYNGGRQGRLYKITTSTITYLGDGNTGSSFGKGYSFKFIFVC